MFFAALMCTSVLSLLACILLHTYIFDKSQLSAELRRMAPWVRVLSIVIGLLAWVMAVTVAATHTVLAVFLTIIGAVTVVSVLALKPAMDRGVLSSKDLT
jgi:hypothetical protein